MKSKNRLVLILMFILLGGFTAWTVYAHNTASSTAEKKVWEYKIVSDNVNENDLNALGVQGWELVELNPGPRPNGNANSILYFKRAK
jgi:hypothetical protein